MEEIRTATGNAADTVADNDVETIEAGNHTDMVVLSRNPLDEITAVQDAVTTV